MLVHYNRLIFEATLGTGLHGLLRSAATLLNRTYSHLSVKNNIDKKSVTFRLFFAWMETWRGVPLCCFETISLYKSNGNFLAAH